MTTTTETHGLVGAVRRLHGKPLEVITALVFAAGIIAVARTAGVALPFWAEVLFGILLGVAALTYEFAAVKFATRSYYERSLSGMAGWAAVWAAAFIYSANAWLGFASEGQENKAAFQKTAYVVSADAGKQEAELTKRNNDLLQRLEMAPKRTAEAAQAAIENAKANRYWQATEGCTATRGPQTRAFCDGYVSAVADAAGAKQLLVDREEQKVIAKQLLEVRSKRAAEGVTISEQRTDLGILVRYTSMGERGAMDLQAVLKVLAISAFLSLTGFLLEKERHRDTPRKPWPFAAALAGVGRWISRVLFGRVHTEGRIQKLDGIVGIRNAETLEVHGRRVQTA